MIDDIGSSIQCSILNNNVDGVGVYMYTQCLPIDGRTIATGKLPASSSNICSVSAFVNVYVFGRLPIKDGVNCGRKRECARLKKCKCYQSVGDCDLNMA